MSTDESVNEQLSGLAEAAAPPPDQAFVENLDARLRVMHADQNSGRRPLRWAPALAAAAVLVIGLVGTVALRRQGEAAVVMTVASDTAVFFEDGQVPGTAGLELPDGTRIVVGAAGEAVVDGVVLAPGSEAVVVDAKVALVVSGNDDDSPLPDRTTTTVRSDDERAARTTTTTATSTSISSSAGSATTGQTNATTSRDEPATTAVDQTAPDRSTPDDGGEPTSTTSEPSRPAPTDAASTTTTAVTETRPSTTTTTTATTSVPAQRITLTVAEVRSDRVRLDWVVEGDLAPAGWRLWVRQGDRESTILVIRGGEIRSATLERQAVSGRSLWVEAVARSGQTLEISNTISID